MNIHAREQAEKFSGNRISVRQTVWHFALVLVLVLVGGLAFTSVVMAATPLPSNIQLSQWETFPVGNWVNGNLGSSNSDYAEGETVPQRVEVGAVSNGTYDMVVCRDFADGTHRGYLYLDRYNLSRPAAPGGTIVNSVGAFSGMNVHIDAVTEVGGQGSCKAGQLQTLLTITIQKPAGSSTAYVLWGGHLAAPGDTDPISGTMVGLGDGASSFPGSSLHMHTEPNKDNSINPSAILPAPLITVRKFDDYGLPLNGWCFSITGAANLSKCASSGSNVVTFSALPLGDYAVSETMRSGYQFVSVGGTNCTQVATNNASVSLTTTRPTATCDFVNRAIATSAALIGFTAKARTGQAVLNWTSGVELEVVGFRVWRSTTRGGVYKLITGNAIAALHPGELSGANYVYRDKTVRAGKTYFYRLEVLGNGGTLEFSDVKRVRMP